MKVIFGVSKEGVNDWRNIVLRITGKKCTRPKLDPTSPTGSYCFTAYIDEADCAKLMTKWYEKAPANNKYDFPWNYRVSFVKLGPEGEKLT